MISKEILEAFSIRIRSPIFGYFALSWLIINWKALFALFFDSNGVAERIASFETNTSTTSLLWFPLGIGILLGIVSPWVSYAFLWLCRRPTDLKNSIQAVSAHNLLVKKQELEDARAQLVASKEKNLIERAKRDVEVESIPDDDIRIELQRQLDEVRKEFDTLQEKTKPRKLSEAQLQNLHIHLLGMPRGHITIIAPVNSPEPRALASQFVKLFEESGWEVTLSENVIITPPPMGLKLRTQFKNLKTRDGQMQGEVPHRVESIRSAFERAEIPVEIEHQEMPEDAVELVIGFKP